MSLHILNYFDFNLKALSKFVAVTRCLSENKALEADDLHESFSRQGKAFSSPYLHEGKYFPF